MGKKFLLIFVVALFITSTISVANAEKKAQQRELIVLFDTIREENKNSTNSYISNKLSYALSNVKVPIIASSNLLEAICGWHLDHSNNKKENKKAIHYAFLKNRREWYLFHHKNSNLVLFVPKSHVKHHSGGPGALVRPGVEWYAQQYGFNLTNMERIDNYSIENILKNLKSRKIKTGGTISDFESMFDTNNKSIEWNIYLSGHGNVKDYRYYSSQEGIIEEVFPNHNTHSNRTDFNYINGLSFKDFAQLCVGLKKINTSLLHYDTCYAVGSNLTGIKEILSHIDTDFIVTTQGLPEHGGAFNVRNLPSFFYYTRNIRSLPVNKQKEFLQKATQHFIYAQNKKNQTFFYLPKSKEWHPFLGKTSLSIDDFSHTTENIDLSAFSMQIFFLNTPYVHQPISLGKDQYLISTIAESVSQLSNRSHVFKKISSKTNLPETIINLVAYNNHYNTLTLAVNELDYLEANNFGLPKEEQPEKMLIQLTKKDPRWEKRVALDIDILMWNNMKGWYTLSQEINSNVKNKEDIITSLSNAMVYRATGNNIENIIGKISSEEIKNNKHLAVMVSDLKMDLEKTRLKKQEEKMFLDTLSMMYI